MKKTKIICTIGPASMDPEILESLVLKGMNVARLNFSHGTHEYHKKIIDTVKRVREKLGYPVAIMLDTKGPEIRTGLIENDSVEIVKGDEFTLTTEDIMGNNKIASISYDGLPKLLSAGDIIKIDDGKLILKVKQVENKNIVCEIAEGGELGSRKSVNVPNAHLDMPYLSEKDRKDIQFGIEQDVDFIAASFVRNKQDVIDIRKFVNYHGGHDIKIISKIENIDGVNNFDEILEYSDGIMVARGDMGVEIEYERLPGIQKRFIKKCYQSGKIVITATQMLESMINNYSPTRAEITDVANAVFDGTSAVMLSGETAMGKHPARVVEVMRKIVTQAEKDAFDMDVYRNIDYYRDFDLTNAICDAACTTAKDVNANAIIAVTKSGYTARRVSKYRPSETIVAATPEIKTFHQLALSWGVYPVLSLKQFDADRLFIHAIDCAKQIDLVAPGDIVVITAGVPLDITGNTNILKVEKVK